MKQFKTLVLLFAVLSLALGSCKKDEEASILGKWYKKKEVTKETVNGTAQDETTTTDYDNSDYVEFKDNGQAIVSEEGETESFTYSYDEKNKKLSVTDSEGTRTMDVKTISDSDLVLYEEETMSQSGFTYKYSNEVTFHR